MQRMPEQIFHIHAVYALQQYTHSTEIALNTTFSADPSNTEINQQPSSLR